MKIGICSYAFRWAVGTPDYTPSRPLTPEGLLEQAAALGAEVVQICDNMPLHDLAPSRWAALARRADELDLTLEVGIQGSRSEHVRRSLRVTQGLGARLLRVVLDEEGASPTLDALADSLRDLLPELHAAGVALAIENHFGLAPQELARLVQAVDDPLVGICLDPLNSITRLVGPAETMAALAPLALSAHAKDARVVHRGTGVCIVGCPMGEGLVDLRGMFGALRAAGRSPNVLVEAWMDRLEDETATLAQEKEWARHGVAYLRQLAAQNATGDSS